MDNVILQQGDCLELLEKIPDKSVNLILADLPYGTTKNKWDQVIPMHDYVESEDKFLSEDEYILKCFKEIDNPLSYPYYRECFNKNKQKGLWSHYERILADKGAILLFSQQPFTSQLVNHKWFRYEWIWEKTTGSGFLNAKKMPLKCHENILVFYPKLPTYNPQKTQGHERKVSKAEHKINCVKTTNYGEHVLTTYDSTERYPRDVIQFKTDKQKFAFHPTQKPVDLLKYFIQTYTNEGDTVLDNVMGSGSTGIACQDTNRKFIGMEKGGKEFGTAHAWNYIHNDAKNIFKEYVQETSKKENEVNQDHKVLVKSGSICT